MAARGARAAASDAGDRILEQPIASGRYGLSSVQWFERLESREYYRDNQ
jgi:hypothetical protein